MPTTYSTNLGISLMANGEQNGTWGDVTNANLGTLIEQAIVGIGTVNIPNADTTINMTQGASATARNLYLYVTGALTATRALIVPTIQKLYIVHNATSGGREVNVKTAAGTGVLVPPGERMLVYADGTNVVDAINSVNNLTVNGDFEASGDVNLSGGTATLSSATITNLTVTGTASLPVAPTSSVTITGGTINNTPIGGSTPAAGAFTTLSASGTVSGAGFTARFASPGPIGSSSASTGAFTTLSATTTTGTNATYSGQAQAATLKATTSIIFPDLSVQTSAGLSSVTGYSTGYIRMGQNTTSAPGLSNNTVGGAWVFGGNMYLSATGSGSVPVLSINGNIASFFAVKFQQNANNVGAIVCDTVNTAYTTVSDYRLKCNESQVWGAMEKVNDLRPITHRWKAYPESPPVYGFLAHEAAAVIPQAVIGAKDQMNEKGDIVPQTMDYGKLTPLLTAAIQEMDARLRKLEAK